MKKIINYVLVVFLLLTTIIVPSCPHVHDENCGYDEITETGCTHEHDESCYIEPYIGTDPDGGEN